MPVATRADQAAVDGDRAAALDAVTSLSVLAEPMKEQPPRNLYREILVSLALLTQPVPES